MKDFAPATGSMEEWNAAYYRLEDYLRAHHVINKVYQSQVILRLLKRAAAKHALNPRQSPTTLALNEAYDEIELWFRLLLPNPDIPAPRLSTLGKVAMKLIDAPSTWPNVFLSDEIPDAFRIAMEQATIQSGPDLRVSSMVPRPLDADPLIESLDETAHAFSKWSYGVLIGMAVLLAVGLLWVLDW
jgi:hypothetical protein